LRYVDWELNDMMKNTERQVVPAIGSLIPKKHDPPTPLLLMISDHDNQHVALV